MSRQAHLQRNYTALGHTGHATAADDGHTAANGAADQTTDKRGAARSGARVEAGSNTASKPTGPRPGTALPWGRGHLDYARLEGDASRPSDQAEQAAAQDLGLWIPRLTAGEQLALAVASDRCLLRGPVTSRREPAPWQTSTLAIGQGTGHRHHEPPQLMALCPMPAHGAYGGLQPG